MYKARIETDAGGEFFLDAEHGIVFDISPLSGIDVEIGTSQGFQQVGESIETQSVAGLTRTVTGVIFRDERNLAEQLLRLLPVFTTGRLYVNDEYYCSFVLQKTPAVIRAKSKKTTFAISLYCASPFWLSAEESTYILGETVKNFSFPTSFTSHSFGTKNVAAAVNCFNGGSAAVSPRMQFYASEAVENFGVENVVTGEHVKVNTALEPDDTVDMFSVDGRLQLALTRDGERTSILSALDDDSSLFQLAVGDNMLVMTADDGVLGLSVSVTFSFAHTGVIVS